MAIRVPYVAGFDVTGAVNSGWRPYQIVDTGSPTRNIFLSGASRFQPSALSRPGNLGTAYSGVWTGNIKNTF